MRALALCRYSALGLDNDVTSVSRDAGVNIALDVMLHNDCVIIVIIIIYSRCCSSILFLSDRYSNLISKRFYRPYLLTKSQLS